jgi:predicted ArsR family transcriptional regulator
MAETDGSGLAVLGSTIRRQIVDTLANLPTVVDPATGSIRPAAGLSAQELAEQFGLHVTTMRFHLDQLVGAGLLTSHFQRREGAGRPRKLYAVERGSLEAVAPDHAYRMLSELLVESFRSDEHGRPLSPDEAGARWGRRRAAEEGIELIDRIPARTAGQWLGKIGQMVDLLKEWGYTPEVSTSNGGRTARVALHDCPFLPLAQENTAVVCGIHRGLIRGVMESLGEASTDVGLTPFVTPHLCVASLTATTPFESPKSRKPDPDKEIHP